MPRAKYLLLCRLHLQWVEQGMDPTHANFLHVGVGFKSDAAVPMAPATTVPAVDVKKGFTWLHGGYQKQNAGMSAVREFHPPGYVRCALGVISACVLGESYQRVCLGKGL